MLMRCSIIGHMAQGAAQLSGSSMKVRSDQGVFFFAVPCCAVDGLLIWFKAGDAKAFCLCFHGSIMAAAVVAFKQRRDDEYKKEQAVSLFFFLQRNSVRVNSIFAVIV